MPPLTSSDAIAAQIAALQAQHAAAKAKEAAEERQKQREGRRVLVEASPVKKKVKVATDGPSSNSILPALKPTLNSSLTPAFRSSSTTLSTPSTLTSAPKPSMPSFSDSLTKPFKPPSQTRPVAKSSLSSALIKHHIGQTGSEQEYDENSNGNSKGKGKEVLPKRDSETLEIIERLELGPKEFGRDPEGGHDWRFVEPNSGIRLRSRAIPHNRLQANLSQRYLLPPPLLYSLIRPSAGGGGYDLDLDAGWATIGVVAGKGNVGVVKGRPEDRGDDDDDEDGESSRMDEDGHSQTPKRTKLSSSTKSKTRHYVLLRLTSLAPPNRGPSVASSGGGDALVNLLLFEADSSHLDSEGNKVYVGGSGGAYEKFWKTPVGDVIGVVGARILKSYGSGNKAPHPLTSPLALNPSSAEDVFVIGRARDLGTCGAMRKDGKQCEDWIDVRKGQYCEYHVHMAVKKGRGGRAEFTASTGGFDVHARTTATSSKGGNYDPLRKTGLLPREGSVKTTSQALWNGHAGGQTYMVGGSVVSTNARNDSERFSERLGRGGEERRKRKREREEGEAELQRLLEREKGVTTTGGRYLLEAERINNATKDAASAAGKEGKGTKELTEADMVETEEEKRRKQLKSRVFHSEAIKRIGFDPTTLGDGGLMVEKGEEGKKRLASIALLRAAKDKAPKLGPLPGVKTRTSVMKPSSHATIPTPAPDLHDEVKGEMLVDLSDSE